MKGRERARVVICASALHAPPDRAPWSSRPSPAAQQRAKGLPVAPALLLLLTLVPAPCVCVSSCAAPPLRPTPVCLLRQVHQFRDGKELKPAVKDWEKDMERALAKYGHISDWDVSRVENFDDLLKDMKNFNDDISRWDMRNAKSLYGM